MIMQGRPTTFTQELADAVCARLANGESLRKICRSEDLPSESTVRSWALDDQCGFFAQYTRARSIGYEFLSEDLLEIADDGKNDTYMGEDGIERTDMDVIARSRIRIDTRKWMLSKMLPKVYGDKIVQEHTGNAFDGLLAAVNGTSLKVVDE